MVEKKEILLESGTNELEVIEFTIADRHFGINVSKVVELISYQVVTPMPNSNPYVEGVFKPRQEVMTLINLAAYLGLPDSENLERNIFIITHFNNVSTAFHVHNVEAIHRISWMDIEKPDATIYGGVESLATGIAHINSKLITILDFEKILADISPETSIKVTDIKTFASKGNALKPLLIAEDSALLEKMLLECLLKAGYENVICCTNGKEAWEKLLEFKDMGGDISKHISCVLTDIEMPQMDGHRLLKLIRDDPVLKVLPVIVFSSLIDEEMKQKGVALGASAQVSKPEIASLIGIIEDHIL